MSVMITLSIILAIIIILLSYLISHKSTFPVPLGIINDESERKSQYECGIEVFEENIGIETRERFFLKFYIIGILFLIFDIETLLLYPISLLFSNDSGYFLNPFNYYALLVKALIVFLIFISILLLGLFYEYRKNVI